MPNELPKALSAAERAALAVSNAPSPAQRALTLIDAQAALLSGARGVACPCCKESLSLCGKHGLYIRTDENQCPGCLRGE